MPSMRLEAALAAAPQISHERVRFMRGGVMRGGVMRGGVMRGGVMRGNVGPCRALGQEIGG